MHLRGLRSPAAPSRSPLTRESQEPIRAELLSPERLEELAERVAGRPVLAGGDAGRLLSPRVRDSGRVLLQCYHEIAGVIREEGAITPAAEWFVDNYHVADEVVRQVREDLPRGFYRQLPKLAEEPLQGYPRVLGLAWEFVAHTDSRLEPDTLQRFVRRFQRVQPLTIGELWAIPIALRLVLVENLRRLAERIVNGRAARLGADALADELLGLGGRTRRPLAFQRVEAARLSRAFMVSLVQRLREQDPESTPALRWLDEQLTALGTSADALVQLEHQNQAALNVTVRNVITSMRMMVTFDWADFFESVSLVDDLLRADRTYRAMDFATRDQYRHAIEDLARGSRRSELDVTRLAMAHARRAVADLPRSDATPVARSTDPGYYLLAQGRTVLEAELGYRTTPSQRFLRVFLSGATPGYLTTIATVTGLLLALPLLAGARRGHAPRRPGPARPPRDDPGLRPGARPHQSRGHGPDRPDPAPAPRAGRGRARGHAHARGRAHAPDRRGRDRGAHQPPGDPLPRQPGRPRPLRPALGLAGRARRARAGGRAAPRAGRGRHRAPQRAQRPGAPRGRALPPAPSPSRLERARGHVDGLGAQAREARAAQPAPDRHRRRRRSRRCRARRPRCPPASATSSPSTRTRACRAARSIASSARWPIR